MSLKATFGEAYQIVIGEQITKQLILSLILVLLIYLRETLTIPVCSWEIQKLLTCFWHCQSVLEGTIGKMSHHILDVNHVLECSTGENKNEDEISTYVKQLKEQSVIFLLRSTRVLLLALKGPRQWQQQCICEEQKNIVQ